MQEHTFAFEVEATPDEVWRVLHPPLREPTVLKHGDVTIDIRLVGDETGKGLVRECEYRVPKWLLSGGVGRSWEVITESEPGVASRYEAVGKPLWSKATGWHRLTDLGGGRTRIEFGETYHAHNPLLRLLFEKRVHRFISGDNDTVLREAVEQGVAARRARLAKRAAQA